MAVAAPLKPAPMTAIFLVIQELMQASVVPLQMGEGEFPVILTA